jgi:hypothetical protein
VLLVGRDADADLVSAHPTASRRHAELSRRAGALRRDDLLMVGAVTIRLR